MDIWQPVQALEYGQSQVFNHHDKGFSVWVPKEKTPYRKTASIRLDWMLDGFFQNRFVATEDSIFYHISTLFFNS
jgi:hypothetical protein